MDKFLNIVIPSILSKCRDYYYISGNRAFDFYFTHKISDFLQAWNIKADKSAFEFIKNEIKKYAKNNRNKLIIQDILEDDHIIHCLRFDQEQFFMYMEIIDVKKPVIEHILLKYSSFNNFYTTLLEEQRKIYENLKTSMNITIFDDILDYNKKYGIPVIEEPVDMFDVVKNSIGYLCEHVKKHTLVKISREITPILKNIYLYSMENNDVLEYIDSIEISCQNVSKIILEYKKYLTSYSTYMIYVKSCHNLFEQYKKIRYQYNIITNMIWTDFSSEYKTFLLSICDNKKSPVFFNISETCKTYLLCQNTDTPRVIGKKNCIPLIEDRLKIIDIFLKN